MRVLRLLLRLVALGVVVSAATGCATVEWSLYPPSGHLEALDAAGWREDVEFLQSELVKRNPHLRRDRQTASRFSTAVDVLRNDIDAGADAPHVIAGIARAIAAIGEAHTSVNASPVAIYPLYAQWFSDGLFVVWVDAGHSDLVGRRVLGIVDASGELVPADGLGAVLNPVIAVDHPNGYRLAHGQVLQNPYLVQGIGLADRVGLRIVVESPDGTGETVTVSPLDRQEIDPVLLPDRPTVPLAASRSERNWWTRSGENGSILYVSYDDCSVEGFAFFRGVLAEARDNGVEALIVDLRDNPGGLSVPGTVFSRRVGRMPKFNDPTTFAVLIGPRTFSSGMMLAVDLMDRTSALFVGEPLAESPNSWGEVKRFRLPNSGLVIGHSTRFFHYGRNKELRLDADGNLVPDLFVARSFAEYRAGIDPVYDAAIEAMGR